MVYSLRFFFPFQNAVCFIILMYLVPILFTFYIQGVLKLKKNNSGAKRLSNWNVSVKFFYQVCSKISHTQARAHTHTHTHTHTHLVIHALSLSLIRRTACAHAQISWCSSTTNAHSETRQMTVRCQNLTLGALSSCSVVLFGALFKKKSASYWTPLVCVCACVCTHI